MSRFTDGLSQLLAERRLSGNEIGKRIGVTGSAVSLWLQGKTQPTRGNVERLEDELRVEPRGMLLEAAGYSAESDEPPTPESLLRVDPGLAPEDRRAFIRLIRMARERFAQSQQRLVE